MGLFMWYSQYCTIILYHKDNNLGTPIVLLENHGGGTVLPSPINHPHPWKLLYQMKVPKYLRKMPRFEVAALNVKM